MATTEQEILDRGRHLAEIHDVLCAAALCLIGLAPEVAAHVDQEQADACVRFAADVLKPAVASITGQLDSLRTQWTVAHAEVGSLEALFASDEADEAPVGEPPVEDEGDDAPGLYL